MAIAVPQLDAVCVYKLDAGSGGGGGGNGGIVPPVVSEPHYTLLSELQQQVWYGVGKGTLMGAWTWLAACVAFALCSWCM